MENYLSLESALFIFCQCKYVNDNDYKEIPKYKDTIAHFYALYPQLQYEFNPYPDKLQNIINGFEKELSMKAKDFKIVHFDGNEECCDMHNFLEDFRHYVPIDKLKYMEKYSCLYVSYNINDEIMQNYNQYINSYGENEIEKKHSKNFLHQITEFYTYLDAKQINRRVRLNIKDLIDLEYERGIGVIECIEYMIKKENVELTDICHREFLFTELLECYVFDGNYKFEIVLTLLTKPKREIFVYKDSKNNVVDIKINDKSLLEYISIQESSIKLGTILKVIFENNGYITNLRDYQKSRLNKMFNKFMKQNNFYYCGNLLLLDSESINVAEKIRKKTNYKINSKYQIKIVK